MPLRPSDIPPARVAELNAGAPSANLAESLALDFAKLLKAALPDLPASAHKAMHDHRATPYTKRMAAAAQLIAHHLGPAAAGALAKHPSDTARGWGCYVIGMQATDTRDAIRRIRPFAADEHFGVREWAWLGVRAHVVADPSSAIDELEPWTASEDPNVRRFATEATRPRGVWCAHITELKTDPSPALPLLEPLRADPTKYVQDSVSNWLNDASKAAPEWVQSLCARWSRESDTNAATTRITKRALRSLS